MTTTTGKDIFAGHRLRDGREIEVAQIGWDSILVSADSPFKLPGTPFLVHGRLMASNKVEPLNQILCLSEMK